MSDYCDVCDSILQPKEINGEILAFCPDCEEEKADGRLQSITFSNKDKNKDPEGGKILIIEESNTTTGRSKKEMYCEECKSTQLVEYWEIQTRSADESATRFFRCTNCDKNWREYD